MRYFLIAITIVTATYAFWNVPVLQEADPYPDYYAVQVPFYLTCELDSLPDERNPLKWWLACFSHKVLDNDKLIPYIVAVAHVPAVALLATRVTGRTQIGVVGAVALIVNPFFYLFDSSAVYDQAWSLFLVLSVLLLYSKPVLSPFSYVISIASKVYAVAFLPMYIYTVLSCPVKGKRWIILSVAFLAAISYLIIDELGVGTPVGFYPERLQAGIENTLGNFWIIMPVLAAILIIDVMTRNKDSRSKGLSLMWMAGIVLSVPALHLFTEDQVMFAYRLVPFAVFMSIYVGQVCLQVVEWVYSLRKQTPHSLFK